MKSLSCMTFRYGKFSMYKFLFTYITQVENFIPHGISGMNFQYGKLILDDFSIQIAYCGRFFSIGKLHSESLFYGKIQYSMRISFHMTFLCEKFIFFYRKK